MMGSVTHGDSPYVVQYANAAYIEMLRMHCLWRESHVLTVPLFWQFWISTGLFWTSTL